MMKKVLVFWGCFCLVFVAYLYVASNPRMLSQDSGWDYDYDSGSSYDSSDSNSSSSRDSSYDRREHDYSSSGSSSSYHTASDPLAVKIVMIIVFSLIVAFLAIVFVSNVLSRGLKSFIKDSFNAIIGFFVLALMFVGAVLFMINGHYILAFLYFIAFPYIFGLITIIFEHRKNKKNAQERWNRSIKADILSDDEIKALDSSIEPKKFMNDVFELYKKIQISWMNFDYEELKKLLSDELYNQYKMQLETLNLKKQQNIMSGFEYISGGIVSIKKTDVTETVKVQLHVKMYDYIINSRSGAVLRGIKNKKCEIVYMIDLEKGIAGVLGTCPQCGAKGEEGNQVCKYCGSTIVRHGSKFVMSKKEKIGQR